MADLDRVRRWAEALIALHLDPSWQFGFDRARTRAGLCDYRARRITVSRLLAEKFEDDDIHQVLLHEVAHALVGPGSGHGAAWKRVAREIGYVGGRTHGESVADEHAPWIGDCPNGHRHYRFRRPTRDVSCGRCSRRFDARFRIAWHHRARAANPHNGLHEHRAVADRA